MVVVEMEVVAVVVVVWGLSGSPGNQKGLAGSLWGLLGASEPLRASLGASWNPALWEALEHLGVSGGLWEPPETGNSKRPCWSLGAFQRL